MFYLKPLILLILLFFSLFLQLFRTYGPRILRHNCFNQTEFLTKFQILGAEVISATSKSKVEKNTTVYGLGQCWNSIMRSMRYASCRTCITATRFEIRNLGAELLYGSKVAS